MSKAFTKEDSVDGEIVIPARAPLPAGVPNYVTVRGMSRLRAELETLEQERAILEADDRDPDERARRLSIVAARLNELAGRIGSAVIVDASAHQGAEARFGATVTLRFAVADGPREDRRYTIVGVDEADAAQGRIAFISPLARAVLGRGVGDIIQHQTARAEEDVEIVAIEYEAAAIG
jgi:transcription elongation factor GreB